MSLFFRLYLEAMWRRLTVFASHNPVPVMLAAASVLMIAEPAAAQAINISPFNTFLQTIVTALTGTTGRLLATIALVGVVMSWWFGVIDFRQALWVLIGIIAVGSATALVTSLWGGTGTGGGTGGGTTP